MKKSVLLVLMILGLFTLFACGGREDDPPFEATLTIENMVLTRGESETIDYMIAPAGTFGTVSFAITESTPPGVISITGNTVSALLAGTATVTATATNMPGASTTFSTTATFTVTVEEIQAAPGEYVLNGGFEFGTNEWTLISNPEDYSYGTQVVNNNPHSGEAALNLWYDHTGNELGEALDLTLRQTLNNVPEGTFLFSLWYQGTVSTVTMRVLAGETVLEEATFSGFDYRPVPDHFGYVNLGIEVTIDGSVSAPIIVEIHVEGPAEVWGYIDDVSFRLGTLEDLVLAPSSGEEGFINFISGGDFPNLSAWTVDISGPATSKQANITGGRLAIWANGVATFRISQLVTVPEDIYNLVIYWDGGVMGDEFNVDEAYVYVKQGETLFTIDLEPTGWTGELTRADLEGFPLAGQVEVGIYINFISGVNNWINLDDFALWSYNIDTYDPNQGDNEAAEAVIALIEALPEADAVTLEDEIALIAAESAYQALTELQKTLVTNHTKLQQVRIAFNALTEEPLPDVPLVDLNTFNAQGNFTVGSWSVLDLDWYIQGGSLWTDGDWAHSGTQRYDMFKDQGSLVALIAKGIENLPAGSYHLTLYAAGGGLSEVEVTFGDTVEVITITGDYAPYTVHFDHDGEGFVLVQVKVTRPDTAGWISLDTFSVAFAYPTVDLETFNQQGNFTVGSWAIADLDWHVEGGSAWTDGDWAHSGTQRYDMFKDRSTLTARIAKNISGLDAGEYLLTIHAAGGGLTTVEITFGTTIETLNITGDYAPYTVTINHDGSGDVLVQVSVTRPDTSGWISLDTFSVTPSTPDE